MNLRSATMADAELLFEWANDPDTRAGSHSTDPIPWDTHVAWLQRVVGDPDRRLWLGVVDGVPVGTGRLDAEDGYEVVSLTIAPDWRGRGLAGVMIAALSTEARGLLVAEIKPGNERSIRAFERSGFTPDGPGRWIRPAPRGATP